MTSFWKIAFYFALWNQDSGFFFFRYLSTFLKKNFLTEHLAFSYYSLHIANLLTSKVTKKSIANYVCVSGLSSVLM